MPDSKKRALKNEKQSSSTFPYGGGEMGGLIRNFDWAATKLGPISAWAPSLRTAVNIILQSPVPHALLWGNDGILIYNDSYRPLAGARHPSLLGTPVAAGWPEVRDFNQNVLQQCLKGTSLTYQNQQFTLLRNNTPEHVWMNINYSPVIDENGRPAAVMAIVEEITDKIQAEEELKRFKFMSDNANDAFILIRQDGTFAYLNELALKQWGYSKEEATTLRVPDVDPMYPEEKFNKLFDLAQRQDIPSFETVHRRQDGTTFPVEVRVKGIEIAGQPHLLAVARDITERKRTNDAFNKVQQQLKEALSVGLIGAWTMDLDTDLVITSESLAHLFGVDPCKAARGLDKQVFFDAIHPDDLDFVIQRISEATQTGEQYEIDFRVFGSDGRERWVLSRGQNEVSADDTPHQFTGVLIDITERKKAEEALQRQFELTEAIINNATAGLFMIDNQGMITYMNPSALKMTGYTLEEAIGQSLHLLCHHSREDGSDFPEEACPMTETYHTGKANPLHEDTCYRKDGTPFPALIAGVPIPGPDGSQNTVVECRDITEEKRSTAALAESEAQLQFLADSMPQQVWTATADGRLDYVNQKVCDYFQRTAEDIIETGWRDDIHADDTQTTAEAWSNSLRTGEAYEIEIRLRRAADTAYRWHLSRALPIRDDAGNIVRWYGSNTDIEELRSTTKRKEELERIAAALQKQRAQLIELNTAKDEFISLSSHQLRTPATGVKQYVGMLLEGYAGELTPKQKSFLEQAYISNERQINIVNDLLKVAQVDAGKVTLDKAKTDLVELIQDILDESASKFTERQQNIIFQPRQKQLVANIDKDKIRMVLENIIDNASKYTPDKKTIEVILHSHKGFVSIAIRDEGVGIPEKDIDKLFHKFLRLDNPLSASVGGSGLGLYWAKKIIDLHEGAIAITSAVGEGSTFTISLPARSE